MDKTSQSAQWVSFLISFLGVVMNLVVVAALYRRKDLRTPWYLVTLPLTFSEMIFGLVNAYFSVDIIFITIQPNSMRCTMQGALTLFICCFSVHKVIIIAWERFRAICYSRSLDKRIWTWTISLSLGFCFIMVAIPLTDPKGYLPSTSGYYCTVPWYIPTMTYKVVGALALLNLTMGTNIIGFCYLGILHHYRNMSKNTSRARISSSIVSAPSKMGTEDGPLPTPNKQPDTQRHFIKDKVVLFKSFVYIVTFILFWFPYILLIFSELVNEVPVDENWSNTALVFAELSSFFNPLILILLSPAFKSEVKSWFSCTPKMNSLG